MMQTVDAYEGPDQILVMATSRNKQGYTVYALPPEVLPKPCLSQTLGEAILRQKERSHWGTDEEALKGDEVAQLLGAKTWTGFARKVRYAAVVIVNEGFSFQAVYKRGSGGSYEMDTVRELTRPTPEEIGDAIRYALEKHPK